MKTKIKIGLFIVLLTILLLPANCVHAVLQSTPQTHQSPTQDNWQNWVKNIRLMENGAMGLSEEINEDTLAGNNNNVDVHMMKNTEYGAIAILSLSNYGNITANNNKDAKPESTTGNITGVYIQYNKTPSNSYSGGEMTSGILKDNIETSVSEDYYNTYANDESSPFIGDAEDEFADYTNRQTTKLHLTTNTRRLWYNNGDPRMYEGFSNGGYSGYCNSFYYTVRGRTSLLSYDAGSQGTFQAWQGSGWNRTINANYPLYSMGDVTVRYDVNETRTYGLWYARGVAVAQ